MPLEEPFDHIVAVMCLLIKRGHDVFGVKIGRLQGLVVELDGSLPPIMKQIRKLSPAQDDIRSFVSIHIRGKASNRARLIFTSFFVNFIIFYG